MAIVGAKSVLSASLTARKGHPRQGKPLEFYRDNELRARYRFRRETIVKLLNLLDDDLLPNTPYWQKYGPPTTPPPVWGLTVLCVRLVLGSGVRHPTKNKQGHLCMSVCP